MKKLKQEKGITLIALVITIIVLLILAGITINLTIGQDGILKRAQEAGKNYTNAAEYEQTQLAEFTNTVDNIIANVTGGGSTSTNPTLVSQITEADYGKSINYSVSVKDSNNTDVTLTDWKVFYNDNNNVYIILGDYLNNILIDTTKTKMTRTGTYQAYWASGSVANNTEAVATLTNTENWSQFATGRGAQSATGGPTAEMLMASYNAKHNTSLVYTDFPTLDTTDNLYLPHDSVYESCYGYWLASPNAGNATSVWNVYYDGGVGIGRFNGDLCGVRPVVCLQSGITGSVGDTVTID